MALSEDTRSLLGILGRAYPWAGFISRSRGDVTRTLGALRLHEKAPEITEKGFAPAGRCVELPAELAPELPEGAAMDIEELCNDEGG